MKNKFSLLLLLIIMGNVNSQTLLTEDCTVLTIGNVSTDPTGVAFGQGLWKTISYMGAAASGYTNTEFQVVNNNDAYGNTFQLTSNTANVGYRALSKNVLSSWVARTPGNNIAEVEFDFNTGPVVTGSSVMYVSLFNRNPSTNTDIELAAFSMEMDTKEITGIAYHTYAGGGEIANITFHFAGTTALPEPLYLLPNTWYRLGFSFNYITGEVIWKEATGLFYKSTIGAAAGIDVMQTDIGVAALSGATPSIGLVDNISIKAVATSTLLNTNQINKEILLNSSIYPNPSNGDFKIETTISMNTIKMYNSLGQLVANQKVNSNKIEINSTQLSKGIYLLQIELESGKTISNKVIIQ